MFEGYIEKILQRKLGMYIDGIDKTNFKVGVSGRCFTMHVCRYSEVMYYWRILGCRRISFSFWGFRSS